VHLNVGVVVALADEAAFSLFEPVGPVGGGELVGGVEPGLDVDADAHLHRRADEGPDVSGADLVPQRLPTVGVGDVVDKANLRAGHLAVGEQAGECRGDRRRPVRVGDAGVAEHDLGGAGSFRVGIPPVGGAVVDLGDPVGDRVELVAWFVPPEPGCRSPLEDLPLDIR
jgi:hypothetical protein